MEYKLQVKYMYKNCKWYEIMYKKYWSTLYFCFDFQIIKTSENLRKWNYNFNQKMHYLGLSQDILKGL